MGHRRFITGAGYSWVQEPEEVFGEVARRYNDMLHERAKQLALSYTQRIEDWMVENAAWEDRTGLARDELYAQVSDVMNQAVVISIGHGVHYGLFLEINYAGKYAILNPAVDHFAPLIFADLKRMLKR